MNIVIKMDEKLYEDTYRSRPNKEPMSDMELLYVNDINGGSYNGQIQIDSSILSNIELWNAYSEAFLEIPFCITYKSSVDSSAAGVINGFMLGLKNGHYNILDNYTMRWDGRTVVEQQRFSNIHVNYKLMTTWTKDDVQRHGAMIGFNPDTAGSQSWALGASRNGDGVSNNAVAIPSTTGTPVWRLGTTANGTLKPYNEGLLRRLETTAFPITSNDVGYGSVPTVNTAALCTALGKNYVSDNAGAAAARVWKWSILCCIRLKDLHDFFDKVPLVKGGRLSMTINYNACTGTFTSAAAASPTMVHTANPTMNTSGNTCPVIVVSANVNNPSAGLLDGTNTISCGIGSNVTNYFGSDLLNQVRLYVPSYKMKNKEQDELLAVSSTRRFKYCDIYSYFVDNIAAGGTINKVLTNGVPNAKALVVVPQMNATAGNNATLALNPIQSLFDTAPATTAPLAAIDNFNVNVAGSQLFDRNAEYDFEIFKREIESVNGEDGNATVGHANGLIGFFEWENSYRYYVADLSRASSNATGMNQSIVLQGSNGTAKIMDYYCFVEYEKEAEINILTGKLKMIQG